MYVVQVKSLDGTKVEYYRASNLTEAKLFQCSTPGFVYIFTAHEFLSGLRKVPIEPRTNTTDFDVIM